MVDCLIAAAARRRGATLLAMDKDMSSMARVIEIEIDEASLPA